MAASPDVHGHDVSPGSTSSSEEKVKAAPAPIRKKPGTEEPELRIEPDLPSDGRDEVGESMIRNLPVRPELSEPPERPA